MKNYIWFSFSFFIMALPYFYHETISSENRLHKLSEESSKHIIQVLRMGIGEQVNITNGKGQLYNCEIANDNRKGAEVKILNIPESDPPRKRIQIGISLIKNAARFEWFLEKAVEIGVSSIVPLICSRTEKSHLRIDRMKSILISAMLQSQQSWLPELKEPVQFDNALKEEVPEKYIAHCGDNTKLLTSYPAASNSVILIGPEGDFTAGEIEQAIHKGYIPVSLGNARLRTETAGVVAITLLNNY